MRYKAIFFDRDNTLIYANPQKNQWRNEIVEGWSGKKFEMDYDKMMELFEKAGYPKDGLKSIEDEIEFRKQYYKQMLIGEGINEDLEERSNLLFIEFWCNGASVLFEEVIEVLDYFKGQGYKMGVISDTSPSLQLTLENLGLGKYFDSYTCSDLVGVMKPDPKIYNVALKSLGVKAEESLYVDDYDIEADGARVLGFTAFHINRKGDSEGPWTIRSLREIVDYVKSVGTVPDESN